MKGKEFKNAFNLSVSRYGGDTIYDFTFGQLPEVLEYIQSIEKLENSDRMIVYI